MGRKRLSTCLLNSFTVLTLLISMFLGRLTCFAAADAQNTDFTGATRLTIVHSNDTHARVKEGEGLGFAKISTIIRETRKDNANVLVLDAGDTFHGQAIATLTKGESIARIMNEIGYDAMAPGNHDFNYGYEQLVELSKLTNFPILAANIGKGDGSTLFNAYIIKEIAGLKVGVFGLATPETTYKTHPDNVKGLTFIEPVEAAKQTVAVLKDKTDLIIAISHLGTDLSSADTSIKVAQAVEGIDLIIDGHSHTTLEQGHKVGGTLIVSTGEYGNNLGIVDVYFTDGKIVGIVAGLITKDLATDVPEDEAVVSVIKAIEDEQADVLSQVVGKTAVPMEGAREKVRTSETNLGNLIADAMIFLTGADCALTNGGGIRASIGEGDITKGEIITVLPFGNYIVTKKVTGADIKAALEHGTKAYPESSGGFPHVSGIKYVVDIGRHVGDRVISITVNGEQLDLRNEYTLATNDFMAAGGDEYTMFADKSILNEYTCLDEAVITYLEANGSVSPAVEGRITVQETKSEPDYYIVQPGDWLEKIAKMFNTTWRKLQELNKLPNPNLIFSGQKIVLPN
ncbi:MAG: LysM peptidoglycan-binding domain-containing protein [Clostridiales bacterium]|nr:LysM peptidoglycan-binding domain-containing protein [Clostridiales bacterium]